MQENPAGALRAHVVPFAAWIVLIYALGEPAGWKYAARTVLCLGLFLWCRPWRGYERPRWIHAPFALLAGTAVCALWIAPETSWFNGWPALQSFYLRWGIMPPGRPPDVISGSPYDPAACGWALTLVRLGGSAFVIAAIEEFFWRGFLYRWLLDRNFNQVPLGRFDAPMFLLVSALFGFEHDRWLVGMAAGLAYGGLALRTQSIWPPLLAHVTTNLLLGIYVLRASAWQFW
jgi:CAAX prenyl protease-like protein